MFVRSSNSTRRAAVSLWLIVVLPVLLAAFCLAVYGTRLRHRKVELQAAVDASALAACHELLHDDCLSNRPKRPEHVLDSATRIAERYAGMNYVDGCPFKLELGREKDCPGDLLFGTLDTHKSKVFDTDLEDRYDECRPFLNAARIEVKRSGVAVCATAYVDRDVIGFDASQASLLPDQEVPGLPIVPLAILCDPVPLGLETSEQWQRRHPRSWEHLILGRQGEDRWGFDSEQGKYQARPDRIPEITLKLCSIADRAKENSCVVGVGTNRLAEAFRQLRTGVTAQDLRHRQGKLLLNDGLARTPPENLLELPQLKLQAQDLKQLAKDLQCVLDQKRIWPLFEENLDTKTQKDRQSTCKIRGFVAARLVEVQMLTLPVQGGQRTELTLVLQPCQLAVPSAVTDAKRRELGPRSLYNPYMGKVRVVE